MAVLGFVRLFRCGVGLLLLDDWLCMQSFYGWHMAAEESTFTRARERRCGNDKGRLLASLEDLHYIKQPASGVFLLK